MVEITKPLHIEELQKQNCWICHGPVKLYDLALNMQPNTSLYLTLKFACENDNCNGVNNFFEIKDENEIDVYYFELASLFGGTTQFWLHLSHDGDVPGNHNFPNMDKVLRKFDII